MKQKVAFWTGHLGERGTDVSMYDYAYYNQNILENESYIFYPKKSKYNNEGVIEKFKKTFKVICVESFSEVDKHLLDNDIIYFYNQKHGKYRKHGKYKGNLSNVAKNLVHCVFRADEPHGDVYATISPCVLGNDGEYPVVPYMISLPDVNTDLREELNIPQDANVFGGYGGRTSFDINGARNAVFQVAKENPNIYFLFANFPKFCEELSNIIHLPCIVDLNKKVEFINTCDAMLWARRQGETFGLAIAEFSTKNKPIIAKKIGDHCHVHLLGDKAIWYRSKNHLINILSSFDKEEVTKRDWNAYRDYTPEKVMKIFDEVFLNSN